MTWKKLSDNDAAANIKAWRVFGNASLKSGFKARMNHWGSGCGSVGRVFAPTVEARYLNQVIDEFLKNIFYW